ncbi:MAG TPA: hypothetical protein VHW23_10070 [Kofleriaceae bacterium]|jgi:hypothetical protein|nr:hypothetical protein [Kofleriaceae bacterium]
MKLARLQAYTTARQLDLPPRAKQLHHLLRNELLEASNTGAIADTPPEVFRRVVLLSEPPPTVLEELRARSLHRHAYCIIGGEKNQDRDHRIPHFRRSDGAWFDFSIVVREHAGALELLAYDFELRFPPGMGVPFLRYDLNFPHHDNAERDLRCHLHSGSDDMLVPAPLMTPSELLAVFIEGAQPAADRGRRTPTAYEARWYAQTHALARR